MDRRKRVVLLGATGSIGESALKVIRQHEEQLELVGAAANESWEKLANICKEFNCRKACLHNENAWKVADENGAFPTTTETLSGTEGLCELANMPEADIVLMAVVGTQGLVPALDALKAGKDLAIASKEILVLAGNFVMEVARESGARILPVDSEHNALFQCLEGVSKDHIEKLILTASGGSFRDASISEMENATIDEALKHPNWNMGPKVTIDSATMANKGLEMIEARWLFGVEPAQVDVVIHRQSIVHSMVQCCDGSILAQMSTPHMTFAIQHALLYPDRKKGVTPSLDFSQAISLDFEPIDLRKYRCLALARSAMEAGGVTPGVFNAANEIAVEAFIQGRISFLQIASVIEKTLESVDNVEPRSLDAVLEYDLLARKLAKDFIEKATA